MYTTEDKQCHFPFTYDSATHYGCVTFGKGFAWCAVVESLSFGGSEWEYCYLESDTKSETMGTTLKTVPVASAATVTTTGEAEDAISTMATATGKAEATTTDATSKVTTTGNDWQEYKIYYSTECCITVSLAKYISDTTCNYTGIGPFVSKLGFGPR